MRELALRHYAAQARRVKRWKQLLNRSAQQTLLARYAIKGGYFCEFQRADDAALRQYAEAFALALELPGASALGRHPLAAQARGRRVCVCVCVCVCVVSFSTQRSRVFALLHSRDGVTSPGVVGRESRLWVPRS